MYSVSIITVRQVVVRVSECFYGNREAGCGTCIVFLLSQGGRLLYVYIVSMDTGGRLLYIEHVACIVFLWLH